MNQKLIMENWRRFVKKTSFKTDMGHLYLFEGRKIKKVSFEKRFNQLNESNRSLEKFVKEWEKSCDYTFTLLERKELLNEQDLQYKIGVQILMMISRIKKWSMKLIMPILRVISKVSKYMNKYPILKTIAKFTAMLIVLAVTASSASAAGTEGDYTELLNWLVANAEFVDPDIVDSAQATLKELGDGGVTPEEMAEKFNIKDLQSAIATAAGEVGAEENDQLSKAIESATDKVEHYVQSTVEQSPDGESSALDVDGRTQADMHGTAKSRGTEWSINTKGTGTGEQSKGYTTFTLKGKGHLPTISQHYSPGQEVEFYQETQGGMTKIRKSDYMEIQQTLVTSEEYNKAFKQFNAIMQKNIQ
tara:strand:+ start:362 stop:1441 length:1080 start_codon:yes stop_codon:yes gene_type:complete